VEARPLVARALALALPALALAAPAAAAQPPAGDLLARLAPVLVHDRDERDPAASVAASGVPGTAGAGPGPVVYGRAAPDGWLQYWLYFTDNPQDRGILRSGRHAGDWEMVQIRVEPGGRPVEAVYAQHSGAERCAWGEVELRAGRPVAYLAHGSHGAYFHAGLRDRTWPDPNDEADGRGAVQLPRVERITERSPAWMRFPGAWGGARAGWFPAEQSSPPGPAFQPQGRWDDPAGWARRARACTGRRCVARGACDGRETALGAAAAVPLVALLLLGLRRRRRRAYPSGQATKGVHDGG
jgi:hypothetical protein